MHAWPQPPQLAVSAWVLVQVAPPHALGVAPPHVVQVLVEVSIQTCVDVVQHAMPHVVVPAAVHTQTPLVQVCPAPQAWPQAPQLLTSVARFWQAEPQSVPVVQLYPHVELLHVATPKPEPLVGGVQT